MKARLIEFALRALSFLSVPAHRRIGSWAGRRMYRKGGRSYQVTIRNIQACFPQKSSEDQESFALKSLIATATMAIETQAIWFRGEKLRSKIVVGVENKDLFDEALATGKGVILLVPHFGNWELAGFWAANFRSITAMYRIPRIASLEGLVRRLRDNKGQNKTVPATPRGVLAVAKALKQGGMTLILPDQQPDLSGGVFSPFFGQQALTITLVSRLIAKTDPVVLVAYARRVETGHVVGFLEPEKEIYSEDQQVSVDAMNRSIEKLVATAPEQYQWEYKRFRKQPEDASEFYSRS
mgnify:CR=1 FL=1